MFTTPRRALAVAVAAIGLTLAVPIAPASAQPGACVENRGIWLFKGTVRTICDTPRRADGSWTRYREFWTPAHTVSARSSCYGGRYSSSCTYTPSYWVPRQSNGIENYPVSDAPGAVNQPLADEPGWIAS
ncbi:hypothetical protein SEA_SERENDIPITOUS_53 [Mycobacterium phage Serendipitous]|uniref:CDGP domain-containing protein n=1 Tax=Mycobacterium phage Serendipitous TaxID=2301619 RepID=A0A385UJX1_9CAUD|nr:hypothetical protein I5G64_gp53 [Mycobacterium phage Serendipitous]AYB70594.1 hypothetical protein SEA_SERENDIPITOUS_53 [Mycobacterium phage Serendipitous]